MLILELCFFLEFELQSPEKWTFTSFKLFSELSWLFFEGEGRMGWLREGQPRGVGGLFAVSSPSMQHCGYCSVANSCPTLCNPMDCSPPGSLSMGSPRQEH